MGSCLRMLIIIMFQPIQVPVMHRFTQEAHPALHGIIANDWFDKSLKEIVNCVGDPIRSLLELKMATVSVSPWRLLTTTITDELKLATQKKGKVIGLSLKDRGAVLPAGSYAGWSILV